MPIDVISLKLPETVKNKFVDFINSSYSTVNPYFNYNVSLAKKFGLELDKLYPQLKFTLRKFLKFSKNPKILILKNFPLDKNLHNVPTPTEGEISKKKGFVSEFMIMALSYNLGCNIEFYPNETQPFNLPFQQVVPHKGQENKEAVNYGAGDFPFHNDRIHKTPIDFHLLYGLRSPNRVSTRYLAIKDLISEMPKDLYLTLFEKKFIASKSKRLVAILHDDPKYLDDLYSSLDLAQGWMIPTTESARLALDWLKKRATSRKILKKIKVINISPGTVVISDHLRILHGRKRFSVSDGGFRRWLQRSYLCKKD